MTAPTTNDLQYIWCSVCLDIQQELEAANQSPQLAITITRGEAVCQEHRRRVDGFGQAVYSARKYLERQNGGGDYRPRGRR